MSAIISDYYSSKSFSKSSSLICSSSASCFLIFLIISNHFLNVSFSLSVFTTSMDSCNALISLSMISSVTYSLSSNAKNPSANGRCGWSFLSTLMRNFFLFSIR